MSRTPTWTKKDGTTVLIKDMTDGHLGNTIRMLQRAALARQMELVRHPPRFQGEMAQICAEEGFEQELARGDDPAYYWPEYDDLVAEAERRVKVGKWEGGKW